jgi:hypothetical protein
MDRQAWIAVSLCVAGLVGWQFYMASFPPPVPPPRRRCTPVPALTRNRPPGTPAGRPDRGPAPPAPRRGADRVVEEKIEPLRNESVELRLTNRGGGISEAHAESRR